MNITTSIRHDGVAVLLADGRINLVTAAEVRRAVQSAVDEGHPRIAVDLSAVDFIDSSGLGALISGLKSTRMAGGDLRIAGATEQVTSVLRLTNLDRILRVYPSSDDAYRD